MRIGTTRSGIPVGSSASRRAVVLAAVVVTLLALATPAGAGPVGTITEFSAGIAPNAGLGAIAAGPDGNLWFGENLRDEIGRITPSGIVTEFPSGTIVGNAFDIAAGPDGNLWFTKLTEVIGQITPTGVVTEYSAGLTPGTSTVGITAGPD